MTSSWLDFFKWKSWLIVGLLSCTGVSLCGYFVYMYVKRRSNDEEYSGWLQRLSNILIEDHASMFLSLQLLCEMAQEKMKIMMMIIRKIIMKIIRKIIMKMRIIMTVMTKTIGLMIMMKILIRTNIMMIMLMTMKVIMMNHHRNT